MTTTYVRSTFRPQRSKSVKRPWRRDFEPPAEHSRTLQWLLSIIFVMSGAMKQRTPICWQRIMRHDFQGSILPSHGLLVSTA